MYGSVYFWQCVFRLLLPVAVYQSSRQSCHLPLYDHTWSRTCEEVSPDGLPGRALVYVAHAPCGVGEEEVVAEVDARLAEDVFGRVDAVYAQHLVGVTAKHVLCGVADVVESDVLVPLQLLAEDAGGVALEAVTSDEQRHVLLSAFGVCCQWLFGDEAVVDAVFRQVAYVCAPHECVSRQSPHLTDVFAAALLHDVDAFSLGFGECGASLVRHYRPAGDDGLCEEVFRQRRSDEHADREGSCRFSCYGDAFGVASELPYVFFQPAYGGKLVVEAVVARAFVRCLCRELRVCVESEDAFAIVCRDADDAAACHGQAGIARLAAAASHQSAAVEIYEYREEGVARCCGSPDVEVQAVFAHAPGAEVHVSVDGFLHGVGAVVGAYEHRIPWLQRLRLAPSVVARWWGGEGYALEDVDAGEALPLHCAVAGVDADGVCRDAEVWHECGEEDDEVFHDVFFLFVSLWCGGL